MEDSQSIGESIGERERERERESERAIGSRPQDEPSYESRHPARGGQRDVSVAEQLASWLAFVKRCDGVDRVLR